MTPCVVVRIVIAGAAFAVVASPVTAQPRGTLRGTITDSATGAPVVDARVAIWCAGCYGRYPTDSAGRYRLDRLPAGRATFEAHCPSSMGIGAEISRQEIDVAASGETILDLLVPSGHCAEPAYSEQPGVFRGYSHMGVAEFSMVVDSVLSVHPRGPSDCRIR